MSHRFFRATYLVVGVLLGLGTQVAWAQDELFVTNVNNSVTVYARTANGNVAPLRTISGAATGLSSPTGLAVDTVNNELVVANVITSSVTVYARTANGNVAPLRTISGAATGLSFPQGLAVDTVNNELGVANSGAGLSSVMVYARTANGNVAPLRTISGAATGLSSPVGLAVDTVNNELVVANLGADSVTVYARAANGNVAPLRTIAGAATGLVEPNFLAVVAGAAPTPTPTPPGATPTPTPVGGQVNVPTLDPLGLIALGLLLAAIGAFALRRMSP